MSDDLTRELAARLIAAVDARDDAALREILHPDFRYLVPLSLPAGGAYEGPETLIDMLGYSDQVYRPGSLRPDREPPIVEGDRAAWRFWLDAVTVDGQPYRNRYAMFIRVQDGRVIELEEQLDTLHLNRLVFKS